jgi:YbgC/YbaW family acyl-CoA thioester hydrolase
MGRLKSPLNGIATCEPRANIFLMPSEFTITRQVEFHETDMAGIMHFANFFLWMESCEAAFFRSLAQSLISFGPGQVAGWPRVNVSCQYLAPLRFNDSAAVKLFVKKLGTRSITYVFQFRKEATLIAQGEMTAVYVTAGDRGEMVAQSIPEAVRSLLQVAPESAWTVL